jgi:tetratricopeptide (TPR) repeat protein
MRRLLFNLLLVGLLAPVARAARDDAAGGGHAPSVQQLIAQLGSEHYAVRRRAEEQLLRMGPEAFDELKNAESNKDLEIAERVRYIVQKMRVQWNRAEDSAEVRRVLARYGDLSEDNRNDRIRQLAALEGHAGLAAVCRIARFDQSPLVARRAAAAILKLKLTADERHVAADAWLGELGTSERPPTQWIRLYLAELDAPDKMVGAWVEANAAEVALLDEESAETDLDAASELLNRHLERCNELKLGQETVDALLAVIDLASAKGRSGQLERVLAGAVRWVIKYERWDVLEPLENRFEEEFRTSRRLLYYLAAAANHAGRAQRAVELAEHAFTMNADDDDQRVTIAKAVAELGFLDWAEREYRRAIDRMPLISQSSMEARTDLAMWLHDREEFQSAADLLGEFCDALDADKVARQKLIDDLDMSTSSGNELLRELGARREFYLACADGARGDHDTQRKRLEDAAKKYDKDPDILIAMYRSQGADEAYRRRTRVRIRTTANYMQALIEEYPDVPSVYNQWAWLIANTEGDQKKAVKYSLRSLELSPDEPSYLDTLGRCYYAVGNYEKAVENQRRAVELAPQYGVMKRQLAIFEKALAEQSAK